MSEKLFMAVDIGTSFIKTGVYTKGGVLLASSGEPVKDERPAAGVFIQRGQDLYYAVCACIRQAAQKLGDSARDICAIAFTGQMAGCIGVDERWNDVTGWSCTLDSRYIPYADMQRESFGNDFFDIGGTNAPVMCSKLDWFRSVFPGEYSRIAKYVLLNGYMIGKLSNIPVSEAKIDYSLITWTGLADIEKREWSRKICNELGIDARLLPEIVPCTDIGGYLDAGIANDLGLKAGIPLVLGAGDKVSGCVGAGVLDEGEMIFEAASYGAISCCVKDVRLDDTTRNYDIIGAIDDSRYYAHKYIQGSGISTDWFINEFVREAGESQRSAFERAEKLAAGIAPGSDNILAIGLLSGSAMPFDGELKGLFMGHTWAHSKGHFYNALLESFSYDLALTLDSIKRMYPEYAGGSIKLIGGGANSSIWPQMLADVTGHSFEALDRSDAALLGAALIAAQATGDIDDLRLSAKAHTYSKYVPDARKTAAYEKYVRLYGSFINRLHGFYQELNRL